VGTLQEEVITLQTAARCSALVQFGLREQIGSLQSRLSQQSEELEAAYTEIEEQAEQQGQGQGDSDDTELAAVTIETAASGLKTQRKFNTEVSTTRQNTHRW